MKGEEFSFLADFVSEDIVTIFFRYQQQQVSETASDLCSYGEAVAEMVCENHSSNIGEQSSKELSKNNNITQQPQQRTGLPSMKSWLLIASWLEEIPEDELDGILQWFYAQMKKEQWRKLLRVLHHCPRTFF